MKRIKVDDKSSKELLVAVVDICSELIERGVELEFVLSQVQRVLDKEILSR